MFDMSWGEIMVIGGVALVVIGPKDLPKALRTVGQMTTKVRRMASEFQAQFNEAMREAELEDVRKEVEGLNREVASATSTGFNPIQTIRDEIKGAVESRSTSGTATALDASTAASEGPAIEEIGPAHHVETAGAAGFVDGLNPGTAPLVPLPASEPRPGHDEPLLATGPGLEPGLEPAPAMPKAAAPASAAVKSVEA